MSDVVHLVYSTENIDNGVSSVGPPKGLGVEAVTGTPAPNFEIDDHSSSVPTTGTIITKYDTRFTGCPPCTV